MSETITIPKSEYDQLVADKRRLDFLDATRRALNAASGNVCYGWKFIMSHNVRRLMAGPDLKHHFVDLNDAQGVTPPYGGCSSVRVAIDREFRSLSGEQDPTDERLIGHRLMEFGRQWQVDGDVIRCRECGRGMGFTNRREALNHRADCKTYYGYPWALLENLLSVPTPFNVARESGLSFQYNPKLRRGYEGRNLEGYDDRHTWHEIIRLDGESYDELWDRLMPDLLDVQRFPKNIGEVGVIAAVTGFLITLDPSGTWPVLHPWPTA